MPLLQPVDDTGLLACHLAADGIFPNSILPLLVYRQALSGAGQPLARSLEQRFTRHQWPAAWRGGVLSYHHYHSAAHEVLGIFAGEAEIRFGGDGGLSAVVSAGDVVVIPAGVAHKSLRKNADFRCVGAYPRHQRADTCYGKDGERPWADRNIARVALPTADPVHGGGGLLTVWR